MSILLVGGDGNMGKRYRTVLDFLGKKWKSTDINTPMEVTADLARAADGIIICTPTEEHTTYIHLFHDMGVPILCEKPISKDMEDLKQCLASCGKAGTVLDMVFQYKHLAISQRPGPTSYNYFRHGNDGLYWDCIQVIGLAQDAVRLKEDSPIWQCKINGHVLDLAEMDGAYVSFIRRWLKLPGQKLSEILEVHRKTDMLSRVMTHV